MMFEDKLTVANPLPVKQTGLAEAPPLSCPVGHLTSVSSCGAQQGVSQDLRTQNQPLAPTDTSSLRQSHTGPLLHLYEVVQDGFGGHVTVDAVVSTQEVRSEVMQQRVCVGRLVTTLLTVVDTLTTLKPRTSC